MRQTRDDNLTRKPETRQMQVWVKILTRECTRKVSWVWMQVSISSRRHLTPDPKFGLFFIV